MTNFFIKKEIVPMTLIEENKPFNKKEYLYELKFDGIRAIAYIENNKVELYSRRLEKIINFPELLEIRNSIASNCILDGEIIIFSEGKVDFLKVLQRLNVKNKRRMELLSRELPALFIAFDILQYDDNDLTELPLTKRKTYLDKIVTDSSSIIKSKIFTDGKKLFEFASQNNFEGIVAKKKNSIYQIGKRSSDWIKIKNLKDADYYIIGYNENSLESPIVSLLCAEKIDNEYHFISPVSLGKNSAEFQEIKQIKKVESDYYPLFNDQDAILIEPVKKATINFLEITKSGRLRHPVFKNFTQ